MVRKSAFTLIELIFAIVIIAISVVSLPMMTQATVKGTESNLLQEAIFAAATELNEVVTAHWDENSLEPGEPNSFARVIDVTSGIAACGTDSNASNYRQMLGHINQPFHRRCLDSNATLPSDIDAAGVESISDRINLTPKDIFINTTSDSTGYKTSYKSKISVSNNADFSNTGNDQNIKKITIEITSGTDIIVKLITYSMNIGEVDYYKREY